jgi:hypothetical protein
MGRGILMTSPKIILLGGRGSFDMSDSVNIYLKEHMALIFHLQRQKHSNAETNNKSTNTIKKTGSELINCAHCFVPHFVDIWSSDSCPNQTTQFRDLVTLYGG